VGPAAGGAAGLGQATGGAGGDLDGSAEMRLGPTGGGLVALSVGVFDRGTLRNEGGLAGSKGDCVRIIGTPAQACRILSRLVGLTSVVT
jgi:hypothetical protein